MNLRSKPTLLVLVLAGACAGAESEPPAGRKVAFPSEAKTPAELAKLIEKQTGTTVDVSALPDKVLNLGGKGGAFWDSLDRLAREAGGHVATTAGRISIRPGDAKAPSFNSGPFRFTFREVNARLDAESGRSNYVVTIDVTWEPWLAVCRIDGVPKVTSIVDETGKKIGVSSGGSRAPTPSNFAELTVRPTDLNRKNSSVSLAGSVQVTMADEFLTFTFDAANPQNGPAQKGVTVGVKKHGKDGADWFAVMEIDRPRSDVVIESYEYSQMRGSTVRLIPPNGNAVAADLSELADQRFAFKGVGARVGAGWKLEYRTPGVLREVNVSFELKNIPLP
jgi:hypothetical protein